MQVILSSDLVMGKSGKKEFFFLIGGKLLYNVKLVSAIQQCKLFIISLPLDPLSLP